jgi:hypothetical protein
MCEESKPHTKYDCNHVVCIDCGKGFNHKERKKKRKIYDCAKNRSKLLGIDTNEFIGIGYLGFWKYLEPQLKKGMTLYNHGKIWQVDHKIPFSIIKKDESMKAIVLHYTNFAPLFVKENLQKNSKILPFQINLLI